MSSNLNMAFTSSLDNNSSDPVIQETWSELNSPAINSHSPLSTEEANQFESLERAIDAHNSGLGPPIPRILLSLHSRLANRLIHSFTPTPTSKFESPTDRLLKKLSKVPSSAIPLTPTLVRDINNSAVSPSASIQPANSSMVMQPFSNIMSSPTNSFANSNVVSSPMNSSSSSATTVTQTNPHSTLQELNVRLTIIGKAAERLKIALTSFLPLTVDEFSSWSPEGKDALSFHMIVSNFLAQSGLFENLWITVLLNALTGTKILLFFEDNHKLTTSDSNAYTFKRQFNPDDIARWSFAEFMNELLRLFSDPRFMENISKYMNDWKPTTFKDSKHAIDRYRNIMAQLEMFQKHAGMPASFETNCEYNKHLFWKCIDMPTMVSFTQHCLKHTGHLPLDAKTKAPFKTLEKAFRDHQEYESALMKHSLLTSTPTIIKHKQIASISTVKDSSPQTCSHCNRRGHNESECLRAHPELVASFICRKCNKTGHTPYRCPSAT